MNTETIWALSVTAIVALIVTYAAGFPIIPALRRLKFGQTILDIGPKWHKDKKQGTPTMGGFMFIIGITLAFGLGLFMLWQNGLISFDGFGRLRFWNAVSGFAMAFAFGFMGFLDDWIKVRKKQNEGLTVNQKLFMQTLIVSVYFTSRIIAGDVSTAIHFPLPGEFSFTLDLWYFYYIVMGLGIIYIVNAVNLTDGIDGLCSSVTVVFASAFMVICGLLGLHELSILSAALAGGCIGFLIWNFNPAKVFMGDTGSLFLGGLVCAIGVGARAEFVMVIAAAVYIWEALTVMIQTTYFKITGGKRLFKMTPIHHSFEMKGWKETKIVLVFSGIGAVFGLIAILLVYSDIAW
ncbi:MAG: phospho-N-acetylmuramoyl-pentapeptide-transferase [Oscillospiraceae bacterium]|nr:phospho-N-acetylmuramoyl-pentapeptide-transferase [Oscillospiraceae bacterium]